MVVGAAQWFPWVVQIEGWSEKTTGHERRQIRWCLKATLTLSANNPEFKTQSETGTKELMVEPLGKRCFKGRRGHPGTCAVQEREHTWKLLSLLTMHRNTW